MPKFLTLTLYSGQPTGSGTPRVHRQPHSSRSRPQCGGRKRRSRSSLCVLPAGGTQREFQRRKRENGRWGGGAGSGSGRSRGGVFLRVARGRGVEVRSLCVITSCCDVDLEVGGARLFPRGGRDLSRVRNVLWMPSFFQVIRILWSLRSPGCIMPSRSMNWDGLCEPDAFDSPWEKERASAEGAILLSLLVGVAVRHVRSLWALDPHLWLRRHDIPVISLFPPNLNLCIFCSPAKELRVRNVASGDILPQLQRELLAVKALL